MAANALPYTVVKLHRPFDKIEHAVMARFTSASDAIFYAKNLHKVTRKTVDSIRVFDVNNSKLCIKYDGDILTH